ncbi:MAG TPA: glutamic-type intramembrane protease PrsW [Bacilli bacterium]
MELISLLAAAIAPGASLLAYFYLKDKYESEPIKLVGKLFVFGILLVFPTMIFQRGLELAGGDNPVMFSFVVSASVEEFFKWFVLYFVIFSHKEFDEPYDGIVYAVSLSLGFATMENLLYAFLNEMSFSSLLMRALLPVSGHALFGVMMGYYLGKAKFVPAHARRKWLIYSLLLPIIWHGLFDYIILVFKHFTWVIVPFMALLWAGCIWRVKRANLRSPYRSLQRDPDVKGINFP